MNKSTVVNSVISLSLVLGMGAAIWFIYDAQKINIITDQREEKLDLLNSRLDSLSNEIEELKKDAVKTDTVKKLIRLKPVYQSKKDISNINEPICELPVDFPRLPQDEPTKVRGQALLDLIDSISYKAAIIEASPSTQKNADNMRVTFANLNFGARLGSYSRTNVNQTAGKVSVDSARINGLAIMGRVAFTGSISNNKEKLDFVLTYIPKETEIKVTSFSESLTTPDRTGNFYSTIFLENDQYKKGLYRIAVYYRGKLVSNQNIILI